MEDPVLKILRIVDWIYRQDDIFYDKQESVHWFWMNYAAWEDPHVLKAAFEKEIQIHAGIVGNPCIYHLCPNCSYLLRFEPQERMRFRESIDEHFSSIRHFHEGNGVVFYQSDTCGTCKAIVEPVPYAGGTLRFHINGFYEPQREIPNWYEVKVINEALRKIQNRTTTN